MPLGVAAETGVDAETDADAVEDAIADRPAKRSKGTNERGGKPKLPRTARDKKFGFGGAGRRSKQNTKDSTDSFVQRGGPGGKKGGAGGKRLCDVLAIGVAPALSQLGCSSSTSPDDIVVPSRSRATTRTTAIE